MGCFITDTIEQIIGGKITKIYHCVCSAKFTNIQARDAHIEGD